jgi:hypothetical protein
MVQFPSLRSLAALCAIAGSALLTGCGTMYVDTATKDIPVAELKKVAQPKSIRLSFEFQTNGAPNAGATKLLEESISKQVKESGLFADVNAASGSNAPILNVVLNNVPITKDAASQGFVTGLTFGLVGSAVTDGYVCTLSYLAPGSTQPVTVTARHAIHTTVGAAAAPQNAVPAKNGEEAVRTMTRQVLSTALRDLSFNSAFN